ncbi:ABC transporter permease [Breznakiella homolactica]|uniref:ABC transporter permease subunit n=1 Tax=Breznakiella homolactica TaxID=2798577 RepID=A0A7T7XKJ5_9SPIR|nr:ABC transporter permease [Breznakiella homolactica]QQO07962.1 ABC transporter permease subunit [Breznakiella homolactica]
MKPNTGGTLALAGKELYSFSYSPAMYGITVFFLLFTSVWLFYFQRFFAMDTASLRPFFAAFPMVFILVIPVITMKSWAEERKLGSIELLLTMPFSEWNLVLGKYLACVGVLAFMLVLTIPLPLTLFPLGNFEAGIIVTEYLGALLLGSSAIALGLFLSSLSKNQGGAFLGSAVVLLVVMLASQLNMSFNLPEVLAGFINFISLAFHFESFSKGIIDSRDAAFFILTTVLFLYLNTRVILFRKWS